MQNYLKIVDNTKFPTNFEPLKHEKYYRRSLVTKAKGVGVYGSNYTLKIDRKINNLKKIDVKVSITTDVSMAPLLPDNIGSFFCKNIMLSEKDGLNMANLRSEYLLSRKNEDDGSQTYKYKAGGNDIFFDGAAVTTEGYFFINLPLSISELDTLPLRQLNEVKLDFYLNDTPIKMGFPAGIEVTSVKIEAILDYFEYENEPIRSIFNGYNTFYETPLKLSLTADTWTTVKTDLTFKSPVYNMACICIKDGKTANFADVIYMKITCENETVKESYKVADFYYNQELQTYITSNSQYKSWLADEKDRKNQNGLFPPGSNAVYQLELIVKSSDTSNYTLNIIYEYPYSYDIKNKGFRF